MSAGRVILISGATGGFGRAAAEMFAEEGARLVLTDRDAEPLAALADSLGPETAWHAGDIADPETSRAWIATALARFGRIDGAFNNAGIEHRMSWFAGMDPEISRQVFEVNVLGVQFAMQAQLGQMISQARAGSGGGAILNTASAAGIASAPKLGAYSASKHAVVGLTRTAAVESARFGVRVNALCPAFFKTRMVMEGIVRDFETEAEGLTKLGAGIPMARIGEVPEVLPAIRFALDPANSFFTGQTLVLDGGLTA
ncbi:MAG: SDR family oxidoreductase [Pseudomonadota bacterium]